MALTDRICCSCQFGGDSLPCYHPLELRYKGLKDNGKADYEMLPMQGRHQTSAEKSHPKDILVPCRRCIGCRLDYSRRWADRLMLELDHSKTALFFTLTYDKDHVTPAMYDDKLDCWWYTLVKKDVQDFNKRLRYFFPDKDIRFFLAGEYGEKTLRPHYHGIYFGLSLSDFPDRQILGFNIHKQPLYTSSKLEKIWSNGNVSIGNVSWQSCAYVARYNLKKLASGDDSLSISRNCLPEFGLMSRRPGIGGFFPLDHPDIFDNPRDKIYLSDPFGVTPVNEISMPSYIFQKLELVNPELYAIIKSERQASSTASFLHELDKTDLDEFEYLLVKERNHEIKANSLIRSLD